MKNPTSANSVCRYTVVTSRGFLGGLLLLGCSVFMHSNASAQTPALLWTTNIGAQVFAVDNQTNVYANNGGAVIQLNGAGAIIQSNSICPVSGIARRDSAGNYYFGGVFSGNFDGTSVGGPCYMAKFASNGVLQWVTSCGWSGGYPNYLDDMLVDTNGGVFFALHQYPDDSSSVTLGHINSQGTLVLQRGVDSYWGPPVNGNKLGGLTSSNFCLIEYVAFYTSLGTMVPRQYDFAGNLTSAGSDIDFHSLVEMNGTPVVDDSGAFLMVGVPSFPWLSGYALRRSGSPDRALADQSQPQWIVARDPQNFLYIAGGNGLLSKYDVNDNVIWSTNHGPMCSAMVVDATGNRFVNFTNGSFGRLASDPPPIAPSVTGPQSQTVLVGSNVTFSVSASGTPVLHYFWSYNGTNIPSATGSSLTLNNLTESQSGNYTVTVTNIGGSITSAPAVLRVKSVGVFVGSQLVSGPFYFQTNVTFSIFSAFANGPIFYTLDGSAPDFSSTQYTGPFVISQDTIVRAIGYSQDFFQSEEADPVDAFVLATHTLTASSSGGGTVSLNPPGGTYLSSNIVTVTATPSAGWNLFYWLGDISGTGTTVQVSMERNKAVSAVFGTTLSTTVAGNGQVFMNPPGGQYPYGTTVRLTGVPNPGNYFGFWGNAATGNTNPLYFTVISATQTVSSIFAVIPAGQEALTIQITGQGQVTASPQTNKYPMGQMVTLTATPSPHQTFMGWSGDANGSQNPLPITMNSSMYITANFSSNPLLSDSKTGQDGLFGDGFRLTLTADPPSAYQIYGSTDLVSWTSLGVVSNNYGQVQFLDCLATNVPHKYYRAKSWP